VSGTVYDPTGNTPLYNVSVYVPNAPLDAIPDGVTCTQCAAPLSGSPIATALTDAAGHFILKNAPAGSNIPLVIQVGKWRRQLTVPTVTQCQDNPFGMKDTSGAETLTRLPRNQSEGHLPLIAITTGNCEGLECVVRAYGFSDSEFTGANGSGRIHLYTGHVAGTSPTVCTTTGATDAYAFWGNLATMEKYDLILNSCECQPFTRDTMGPAYANMKSYLEAGGRAYMTDWMDNWFQTEAPLSTDSPPSDFTATANWMTASMSSPNDIGSPYFIDTTFPKGQALDTWLQNVLSPAPTPGQVGLNNIFHRVAQVNGNTTRWIYASSTNAPVSDPTSSDSEAKLLSFNTPTTATPDKQCGRAVFGDFHVSQNHHCSTFPTGCDVVTKDSQVTAFEFLFFDIASCVQDNTMPPIPPPIN
jgi:hypothetical protein